MCINCMIIFLADENDQALHSNNEGNTTISDSEESPLDLLLDTMEAIDGTESEDESTDIQQPCDARNVLVERNADGNSYDHSMISNVWPKILPGRNFQVNGKGLISES